MPRNPDGSLQLKTIGDLIDEGYCLTIHCKGTGSNGYPCHHSVRLDLPAVAQRIGRDHSYKSKDLDGRFKCSACGSKDIGFILSSESLGVGVSTPSSQPDFTKR